jgi:hypothetical protein
MVKTVKNGNGTTHFFPVVHGKRTIGRALAFVPTGVGLAEMAPMVVYFHGKSFEDANSLETYLASERGIWDIRPVLRDEKVLLVMPWGGPLSQRGFASFFGAAALTELIQTAMRVAVVNGGAKRELAEVPWPSSLVLAGHSGGGLALLRAANAKTPYSRLLTDVWALDCMYWQEGKDWVKWCNENPDRTLHVRVADKDRKPRTEAKAMLKTRPKNADIQIVGVGHFAMPKTYAPEFI